MPTGIYIDHGKGSVVDMTTRFSQFKGRFEVDGQISGAFTDSSLSGRDAFYMSCFKGMVSQGISFAGIPVTYNKATGTFTWDFRLGMVNMSSSPEMRYFTIFYGAV